MHRLFRKNGSEIWRAEIIDYQRPQDVGNFVVPYQVKISCPDQKVTIEMKLKSCKVNKLENNPALLPGRKVSVARYRQAAIGRGAGESDHEVGGQ